MPRAAPCRETTGVSGESPVELHIVSDATGETAIRVVAAVQVQFPEQEFAVVRHPRAETIADLQLALERMKGKPSVVIYTLVEPELRQAMRELCRRGKVHYCDLLQRPLEAVARVSGRPARMEAGARPDRGDRVRRTPGRRAGQPEACGRRPLRRLADIEDAALDLPRLPRLARGER